MSVTGSARDAGLVTNEFASVRVVIDNAPNSPVLCLTDTESGDTIRLDALELQTILRTDPSAFIAYPAGWRETVAGNNDEGITPCSTIP